MLKKYIFFFITSVFIFATGFSYAAEKYIEYGNPGYWTQQCQAWAKKSGQKNQVNIIHTIATGAVAGYQDSAILANLLDQTPSDLNNSEGNKNGKSDRNSYLQLFKRVVSEYGGNTEGTANSNKKQLKQFEDKFKEICKDKTISKKEETILKEIAKKLNISYENIKSQGEVEKSNSSGESIDEETSKKWADTSEAAQESIKDAEISEIELSKRKLGYSNESTSSSDTNVDETISEANDFINKADTDKINQTKLSKAVKSLYNILLAIAIVVAVIVGIYMAIKLITSSVEGKAKIKEMFVPYIVGCIVAFGAFGVWALIMRIFNAM